MPASSSILRGKRKIRRCKRKPAGVNDISRFLLWSGKTKSPAYFHTLSIFGGRGWITQAAHLKRPRRGLFAAGTYSGGRCCSNPPLRRFTNFQIKQKLQCHYNTGVLGGRGWIRTTEAEKQQIYSLSPLATREHAHIQFFCSHGLPVYITTWGRICQLLFTAFSEKKLTARLSRGDGHSGGLFWRNGGCGGS